MKNEVVENEVAENEVAENEAVVEATEVAENPEHDTYKVELLDDKDKKGKIGGIFALISFIMALVSFGGAVLNLTFALLTVVATLLLEIMPFIHAALCLPMLLLGVLSIVFACLAKKNGNTTKKRKFGFIIGIVSTAILALSIIFMTILGVIALIIAIILAILGALVGAALSSVLGVLATISPALAPILTILGGILIAVAPVFIESFSDELAAGTVPLLIEWFLSLFTSGVIIFPMPFI